MGLSRHATFPLTGVPHVTQVCMQFPYCRAGLLVLPTSHSTATTHLETSEAQDVPCFDIRLYYVPKNLCFDRKYISSPLCTLKSTISVPIINYMVSINT